MSVWQFYASVDGWMRANSADDGSLTKAEKDDLWNWVQEGPQEAKGTGAPKTVH